MIRREECVFCNLTVCEFEIVRESCVRKLIQKLEVTLF